MKEIEFKIFLLDLFEYKKTGNQILKEALDQGKNEGLRPQIYTHPLGTFGHSAGTTFRYVGFSRWSSFYW